MRKDQLNEFNQDELKEIDAILTVQPTMREYFFHIIFLIAIGYFCTILYSKIPLDGVFLDEIIKLKLKFLHIKISHLFMATPIRIIGLLSYFAVLYIYFKQKFTYYKLTDYDLEIKKGIFSQKTDVTAWVHVDDEQKSRTFLDILLGLGRIQINSAKDKTNPIINIKGITNKDAENFMNYVRKNAIKNYTEWRITQEKLKKKSNIKQSDNFSKHNPAFEDDATDN